MAAAMGNPTARPEGGRMDGSSASPRRVAMALAVAAMVWAGAPAHAGPAPAPPAPVPDPIRAGYELIERGDAAGAKAHFETLARRAPDDLAPALGTLCAMHTAGLDEPGLQREFEDRAERLIARARARHERDRADLDALFHLAFGYGRRALYRYNYDKGLWGTARDAAQARKYAEAYRRIDPTRDDIYVPLGFYDYYVDIAPGFVRLLQPLLGLPRGSRAEGIRRLERAARDGDLFRGDARYELVTVYMVEGRPGDALRVAEQLAREYPESPRAGRVLAVTCLGSPIGDDERAERVLRAMLQRVDQGHPHFPETERCAVLLLFAQALRQQWRFEEAVAALTPAIQAGLDRPEGALPRLLLLRGDLRSLLDDPRAAEDARRVLAAREWAGRWHREAKAQLDDIAHERRSGESAAFAELIPANRLAAERRWDEADAAYRRLRERRPDDWQVRYRQTRLEFERDSLARALSGFREIVRAGAAVRPAWVRAEATLYLGRTHDLLGHREEAVRCYKAVVSDHEQDGDALAARMGLVAPFRRLARG